MSFDVFFYEAFAEEAAEIQALIPPGVRAGFTWKTIQEHGLADPEAPLVSVRTQSVLPPAWGGRIDAVLTRSTGYDHVWAFRRAAGQVVPAGYLPCYCVRAVAEQCMLLWTALLRKLPRQVAQLAGFQRDGLTGRQCLGKTVLVVGVGNERILQNLRALTERGHEVWIRVPLIPGLTDDEENLTAVAEFVSSLPKRCPIHLLPYHATGGDKYGRLDLDYPLAALVPADPRQLERQAEFIRAQGLEVHIGG